MTGEDLFECIGKIDDTIIESSEKTLSSAMLGTVMKWVSAAAAVMVAVMCSPFLLMNMIGMSSEGPVATGGISDGTTDADPPSKGSDQNGASSSATAFHVIYVDDCMYEWVGPPLFDIDNTVGYHSLLEKTLSRYGLSPDVDISAAGDYLGEYSDGMSFTADVYTLKGVDHKNVLLGEIEDKWGYLVFCNETGMTETGSNMDLEKLGYTSAEDITGITPLDSRYNVSGKTITDRQTIEKLWDILSTAEYKTREEYERDAYLGIIPEYDMNAYNERSRLIYNSTDYFALNYGSDKYRVMSYNELTGYIIMYHHYKISEVE